jgi:dolichol-phosphate mannosyltransferase
MYRVEKINARAPADATDSLLKRLLRIRVLSFMLVGGIGYIVNMGVYYPLTIIFRSNLTFLGQQFYLPPYLISSLIAITSNYYLNRLLTFRDVEEMNMGMFKYVSTYLISLPIEVAMIFLLVQFLRLEPVLAAGLAILIVFVGRYVTVKTIVWRTKSDEY